MGLAFFLIFNTITIIFEIDIKGFYVLVGHKNGSVWNNFEISFFFFVVFLDFTTKVCPPTSNFEWKNLPTKELNTWFDKKNYYWNKLKYKEEYFNLIRFLHYFLFGSAVVQF